MAAEDNLNKAKQEAQELNQELAFIADAVRSIGSNIEDDLIRKLEEAGKGAKGIGDALRTGYKKDVRDASKLVEDLVKAQGRQKEGLLKQSEISKLQVKLADLRALKQFRLNQANAYGLELNEKNLQALESEITAAQKVLDGIDKKSTAFGGLAALANEKFKQLKLNVKDLAAAVLKFAIDKLKEFDTEVANIQRGFAVTKKEGIQINQTLARTALSARTLGVNLETVTKGTNDLNAALGGTANLFNTDIRNGVAFAEKRLGLSAEAASNLAIEAINSGKAFNDVVAENEAAFKAVKATTGVSLNFRQTLEEANKISGALRLNLEQFPGGIIEAVAAAKSLGLELEQIKGIQSSILDFESSIKAELQAELLTGKELNLERARSAALNNDIAGLTEEIASQFGSIAEFQQLNFVQQKAFADAVGLSTDDLANVLRTQESINNTLATGVETQGESLTQNASALSAQEALTESIASLNTILKTSLGLITGLAIAAAIFLAIPTGGLSLGLLGTLGATTGGAALIGAGGGLAAGLGTAALVNDGIAPASKGPFTITDSYGATAVTTKGDNVVVSPNVAQGGNSDSITKAQANEMIALLRKVADKDFSISMDGRKLNNAIQTSGVSYGV
jgi:hypothetical protein